MNSNGVTLSLKASELILDSCINLITFSLNATNRNSYKKLMKKDLFDIVVKNIRNFLELRKNKRKKINVSIQFMSSRLNKQKEMEELFSEYLDADTLVYNRYVFNKPVINNSKKQLIDINRIETLERHPCWSIYSRVYIDVKGNVYPCTIGNDSYRETSSMNLGNINKNDLIDIFNSEPIKNAREKSEKCDLDFQECMDCTLWELFPNNFKLQYGRWKQNNDIIIRKKNMNRLD
jgi:radical SAM protein with 4Fe4S-binding SPASM domain